jgi:signal transduction histidine kinase
MSPRSKTAVPGASRGKGAVSAGLHERELRALIELARLMNAIIDRDVLLRAIMRRTAKVMGAEGTSVILLKKDDNGEPVLEFHVVTGERAEELRAFRMAWGEGYVGKAAALRRPVVANDLERDRRHAKRVDRAIGFHTRSLIAVPLLVRAELVGVLEIVNKLQRGGFSKEDVRFAQAIAAQAAVAIERARLVEENLKKQRLAAIGETIAGAAHCVKNIVNAIRGGAYVLNKGIAQERMAQVRTGWKMLEGGVERVSALSLDMLTYSKERKPERKDTDLGALVAEAANMVRVAADERGVRVSAGRRSRCRADIDPTGIQRCVLNLLSNAVDACAAEGKGKVALRCRRAGAGHVEIAVADDGPGMPPDVQKKLFRPFFSTKGSKGTGLGLSVTRKIVEEHGGTLSVASKVGKGTTFTIRLPRTP